MTFLRIKNVWFWPVFGSIAALVASPLVVWITNKENYYALVLFPLIFLLWVATRLKRDKMGLNFGNVQAYLVAFYYPCAVIGLTILIAWISGQISLRSIANPDITATKVVLAILLTLLGNLIVGILTEEGFFRGWLWGILEKKGSSIKLQLIWTSVLFSLWHAAVTFLCPSFNLPMVYVLIYLGNVLLIGLVWGMLRQISQSIIVTSFSHALWNTPVYILFGTGSDFSLLGITSYWIFDPERGLLGLVLNLLAVIFIWRWNIKPNYS